MAPHGPMGLEGFLWVEMEAEEVHRGTRIRLVEGHRGLLPSRGAE